MALEFSAPAADEFPPTKFDNPWWCRPAEWLFRFLGIMPGYREADISPFFFPFLTLFTAMLVGDAGYGLTAMIAIGVSYKTLRRNGVEESLLHLLLTLFAGVSVYGMLTNSWFGTSAIRLTRFDPMSASGEEFLKWFCFFLGSVHITCAHLWKMLRPPMMLAKVSEVGWIIFIWAMRDLVNLLIIGGKHYSTLPDRTIPLFYISLTLILFFTAPPTNLSSWASRGLRAAFLDIIIWLGLGLGAIARNAAGFLSDIISYIRLWAVGMAGAVLGASFNQIAETLPFLVMLAVLVGAHLMNFALGLVAIMAHGVRLNLLEFSTHMGMEWSGRAYDPFRKSGIKE